MKQITKAQMSNIFTQINALKSLANSSTAAVGQAVSIIQAKRRAATEAEHKRLENKTKGIKTKDLRTAINLGLGFKEAAHVGLKTVKKIKNHKIDLEWMENFIRLLFEKNDHDLHFKVICVKSPTWQLNSSKSWIAILKPLEDLLYFSSNLDRQKKDAQHDAEILNKFILNFYGIKKSPKSRLKPPKTKRPPRPQ